MQEIGTKMRKNSLTVVGLRKTKSKLKHNNKVCKKQENNINKNKQL